jgi:hypothetical protein
VYLRSEQTGAYVALDLNGQVGCERDIGARARCAHDDTLRESRSREEDAHCKRPEMHRVSGVLNDGSGKRCCSAGHDSFALYLYGASDGETWPCLGRTLT